MLTLPVLLSDGGPVLWLLLLISAVAVAVRGPGSNSDSSPNISPSPMTASSVSRPSLEALAVLAYRGPLTRPELEQIRGVQSSMILRNLMIRGLVEMKEDLRLGQPVYRVTVDFLKHIGADRVESLPDFEKLLR